MSIEDRDWYREEFKKKQGRPQPRKSENKPQKNSKTINEFLTGERQGDKSKEYSGVKKRETIRTVKFVPKISVIKASFICVLFMFVTFSATMLILAAKPTVLNSPYQLAIKAVARLGL